ncbi:MAG TPA: hypothetical protein VJ242_04475 [Patescibacteria group bacterium]|nr:hypothetical protein [Patescibacteria group bacterium]
MAYENKAITQGVQTDDRFGISATPERELSTVNNFWRVENGRIKDIVAAPREGEPPLKPKPGVVLVPGTETDKYPIFSHAKGTTDGKLIIDPETSARVLAVAAQSGKKD